MNSSTLLIQKLTRVSKIVLGDLENATNRRGYMMATFSGGLLLVLGSVIGFLTTNSGIGDKTSALSTVSITSFGLLIFFDISIKKEKIAKLLDKMENENYTSRGQVLRYANILVKKKLVWKLAIMLAMCGLPLMQIVLQSLQNKPITAKYSLLLPFWLSCADNNDTNVILETICYRVRTNYDLVLINGIQILAISLLAQYTFGAIILFSVTIYELTAHVEIFRSKIHTICDTMNRRWEEKQAIRTRQTKEEREDVLINQQLIHIIEYQKFLKSCAEDAVEAWAVYSADFVINHFITLSAMVFIVLTEKDNAALLVFRVSGMIIFNCFVFTMICWYGYFISDLNEVIFDDLCNIPWYQLSTKFRKMYAITLSLNHTPTSMKVLNTYEISLRTIVSIIRTTYSVLNFMIIMQNK